MADRLQETRWKPFERLKIQSQTHNSSLTSNPLSQVVATARDKHARQPEVNVPRFFEDTDRRIKSGNRV